MTPSRTGKSRPRRVLLVDDQPIVRHGLRELLLTRSDLEVVGEASTTSEAFERQRELGPDLVITEVMLERGSGLDLIKQMKAHDDGVRIVVSSVHDETHYAERCLQAGAMAYVPREAPVEDLLAAIRKVLDGNVWLSKAMTEHMLRRMASGKDAEPRSPVEDLSDRELEVFEMIGQGKTTREIAEALCLSVKTIETYRENLKSKLGVENGTQLGRFAVQWLMESQGG